MVKLFGLLNKILKAQVSDTTGDAIKTKSRYTKNKKTGNKCTGNLTQVRTEFYIL